ncbi:DUF6115 domain-containing protein [Anaeromicropila herbilytica]|uniref:DUF6115 domain-containing protein n=1 Tax=Anaeromicropila herbilytica TaxID=2785025 RepID=UPI00232A1B2D|nr:DUF6115 domain-containing protein [Anaeromicropila herbilytica]
MILIFVSYFASEKLTSGQGNTLDSDFLNMSNMTDEGRQFMMHSLEKKISENADEIVVKVDDELSQISNEKIIAVSEYSDQVLEKINQNHEEVVFMYHMLAEKENELKAIMKEYNDLKSNMKHEIPDSKVNENIVTKSMDNTSNNNRDTNNIVHSSTVKESTVSTETIETGRVLENGINQAKNNRKRKRNAKSSKLHSVNQANLHGNEEVDALLSIQNEQNNNGKILDLYKSGMTVVDIAKQLDLGQGEVKLVIDLFKGMKG